jgi:hypothetical protein
MAVVVPRREPVCICAKTKTGADIRANKSAATILQRVGNSYLQQDGGKDREWKDSFILFLAWLLFWINMYQKNLVISDV